MLDTRPRSQNGDADAAHVERRRQHIRRLVGEMGRLARSEVEPVEFQAGFLDRVVGALAARAGGLWMLDEQGTLALAYHVNLDRFIGSPDPQVAAAHRELVLWAFHAGQPVAVPPRSGGDGVRTNPTDCLILFQPVQIAGSTLGLIEVLHDDGTSSHTRDGYQQFLNQAGQIAGEYYSRRRLAENLAVHEHLHALDEFTRRLHASLDPAEVAATAVNDGRLLLNVDRMSLAVIRRRVCRIEAVSGQDVIDPRSDHVCSLINLVDATIAAGASSAPTGHRNGTTLPTKPDAGQDPRVAAALEAHQALTGAHGIRVHLLADDPHESQPQNTPFGALIVERFHDSAIETVDDRMAAMAGHVSLALRNALHYDGIPLRRLRTGFVQNGLARRRPRRWIAVLMALLASVGVFAFVPADFTVEATGVLTPEVRRHVFAEESGVVDDVLVAHGQRVSKGEPLVRLNSVDLEVRIQEVSERLNRAAEEFRIREAQHDTGGPSKTDWIRIGGELKSLSELRDSLRRELALLERRREQLVVCSPIDGIVATWDPETRLAARPVTAGQHLLEVVDDRQRWILDLKLPEDRLGYVLAARQAEQPLTVDYILATQPEQRFHGRLERLAARAEYNDIDGSFVRTQVALTPDSLPPHRPGAEVRAHLHCGRRSFAFVWFHEVIEFVQSRVLF